MKQPIVHRWRTGVYCYHALCGMNGFRHPHATIVHDWSRGDRRCKQCMAALKRKK